MKNYVSAISDKPKFIIANIIYNTNKTNKESLPLRYYL